MAKVPVIWMHNNFSWLYTETEPEKDAFILVIQQPLPTYGSEPSNVAGPNRHAVSVTYTSDFEASCVKKEDKIFHEYFSLD